MTLTRSESPLVDLPEIRVVTPPAAPAVVRRGAVALRPAPAHSRRRRAALRRARIAVRSHAADLGLLLLAFIVALLVTACLTS